MKAITNILLEKVKDISSRASGGEKFFDLLDAEIIETATPEMIIQLFKLVKNNHFLILSGGFGKKLADGIDKGEYPKYSYLLYKGGIRSGSEPYLIKASRVNPRTERFATFLDDSIYGGATYRKLQEVHKELRNCAVIYDGCPIKHSDIQSLFRYYDHFKAKPNFDFSKDVKNVGLNAVKKLKTSI